MRAFLLVVFCAVAVAGSQVLTVDDVVKMVQAGIAQDLIVKTIVESASVEFQMKPDQLIALKKAGVPDEIVRAMVGRHEQKVTVRRLPFSSMERVVSSGYRVAVPSGSRIYVAPGGGFDTSLAAALLKTKVPVVVVGAKDGADYELSGGANPTDTVKLMSLKTREMVFAYTPSKKDAKHSKQTPAEVCAKHIQEAVAAE